MADADDLKVDDVEEGPEPGAAGDGGPERAPPAYGGAPPEERPAEAPASRPQSGAAGGSQPSSARARASAKPEPEPARSDPEKGAAAEPVEPPPEWAERWLSNQNKADKMNAFRQYIERVQDQAEGPVASPSAEERHASAYWVTNRFLLDRCSAHGVPHIMRHPSRWRRLFWALVVVGALVALVVQVRATLSEYLRYPKKVTIEILEDSTPEFPSVTICNFNILSSDKMSELDKYRDIVSLEQDIADQGMDCGEYISEFDGYYSKNDAYEYDYMWMYEDGVEPGYGSGMDSEYGSGSGSGMESESGSGSGDPYSTYDTTDGYGGC
ncbi:uncharacterized protein LOC122372875 [Amphibalanus amphitrite]|uniref:uncharacterized protein LOC122372875 n=1 Tax=Amphibalanus amphitrite TaxID=1232801 RepID=UPI001C907B41|nr:uncharacterized protein LOC122372875 [Amphibalanus amphitrite]